MSRAEGPTAHAANSTAMMIVNPRSSADLRAAQVAIAGSVLSDERLLSDWEREADLADLLDALGLYRRLR